ncbi:RHS repeat-associated core domain-containing protein [Paenimyroides ummariense]|uniref:RHS repeat-associated core domain-containing protein n=2 Tax=Paenimyroides ummariense TaxID=913024 RepID=A0A1I5GT07_9FLAO|nr:RHS repeat-associated core domain-containing protein [Paenimyroides ummariense]
MDLRQYDPAIGRWLVQDPVVHHEFSPYSAFDNNPVYWSDPSGADSETYVTIADLFNKAGSGITTFNFENGELVGESFTKSIETSLEQTYLFLDAPTEGGGGASGGGNGNGGGDPKTKFKQNNNLIGTTAQSVLSSSIVFEGLSDSQLEYFRVIPEDARDSSHTIIPKNVVKYKTDGLYMKDWSESNYWFKIGNGRYVTVTNKDGVYYAKDSSIWVNSIALQLYSAFNFKSVNKPHWVNNPFNSK